MVEMSFFIYFFVLLSPPRMQRSSWLVAPTWVWHHGFWSAALAHATGCHGRWSLLAGTTASWCCRCVYDFICVLRACPSFTIWWHWEEACFDTANTGRVSQMNLDHPSLSPVKNASGFHHPSLMSNQDQLVTKVCETAAGGSLHALFA